MTLPVAAGRPVLGCEITCSEGRSTDGGRRACRYGGSVVKDRILCGSLSVCEWLPMLPSVIAVENWTGHSEDEKMNYAYPVARQ